MAHRKRAVENRFSVLNLSRGNNTGCPKLNVPVVCPSNSETSGQILMKICTHNAVIGTNFVLKSRLNLTTNKIFMGRQKFGAKMINLSVLLG